MAEGDPSGWEVLRALNAYKEEMNHRFDAMMDRFNTTAAVLRESIKDLEGQRQESQQYRRTITVAVTSALVAATLSLVVSLVLHFAFS